MGIKEIEKIERPNRWNLCFIFRLSNRQFCLFKMNFDLSMLATFSELRACKTCGNVFSIRVGDNKILNCPQCRKTDFEDIEEDKELVQE